MKNHYEVRVDTQGRLILAVYEEEIPHFVRAYYDLESLHKNVEKLHNTPKKDWKKEVASWEKTEGEGTHIQGVLVMCDGEFRNWKTNKVTQALIEFFRNQMPEPVLKENIPNNNF